MERKMESHSTKQRFVLPWPETMQSSDNQPVEKKVRVYRALVISSFFLLLIFGMSQRPSWAKTIDLSKAVILVGENEAESTAAQVLREEVEKHTGIQWTVVNTWPVDRPVIVLTNRTPGVLDGRNILAREGQNLPECRPEGYRLCVDTSQSSVPVVWLIGADERGVLYAVGAFLRHLDWGKDRALFSSTLDIATAPAYPIRGHQLGYRAQANSWDAWTVEQFDQYIRELAFFGINSVENIPFEDDRETPVMKVPRREMNRKMSEICARYGLDYWVWTPAEYDLRDRKARAEALDKHEELYRDCPELTGVFFPGGDPGHNPPELVLPFLEDIAKRLLPIHPNARVWLSLQWFNAKQITEIFDSINTQSPDWLGGLVGGPSSPPIPIVRKMLPEKYKYRLYPDITHNKICQYPVPWWDQAYALTLGREAINPRPTQYAYIHNWFAPYSDGFISYSDGVHDDVNKTIWSARSWDPETKVRDILVEYARVFFDPRVEEKAADGILALEKNWRGPLIHNGSVEGTLLYWQQLEKEMPDLAGNWRWQMCLVRAYYDAYTRHRLINEMQLEEEANRILADCGQRGADAAMTDAMTALNRAVTDPVSPELRARIVDLCEQLFQSCGLQTSVEKYHASGAERGAFLDFIDYPLNNRWWLEDEFKKIRAFNSEEEKCRRLDVIASWECPGPGSYYDDVGNTAKSPHVLRCEEVTTEPGEEAHPEPTFWWWDEGKSRARLSWQTSMNWPLGVVYEGLDPDGTYMVRLTGYGQLLLKVDGVRVNPTVDGKVEMGEFKEFHVPRESVRDRKLVLTWDTPTGEEHLNWRQHSRLSEVWLLKVDSHGTTSAASHDPQPIPKTEGKHKKMKIMLMTDMEGCAGVMNVEDWVGPEGRYYEKGKRLTTEEANAAIEGFFEEGATEVIVVDGHGHGAIDPELLDARAQLQRGHTSPIWPWGLDRSFDAYAIVGQHAKAGTSYSHMTHTGSHNVIDYTINGLSVGEYGQMALCAMELGVPTILACGEEAFTKEAEALTPGVVTVSVKRGLLPDGLEDLSTEEYRRAKLSAVHLSPARAGELIRAGAIKAMRKLAEEPESFRYPQMSPPYVGIVRYRAQGDKPPYTTRGEHPSSVAGLLNSGFKRVE